MKTFDSIQFNKKCANFLQAEYNEKYHEWHLYGVVSCIDDGENEQHYFEAYEMKFDSDWNWLMTIIDKIEDIVFDENNFYNVTIGASNYCVIQDANGDTFDFVSDGGGYKMETVVFAVDEFLNFLNEK